MVITCRELTELATDKKEGVLSGMDRLGIRVHLSWCTRCRTYLEQMDLAVDALAALPDEAATDEVVSDLVSRFESKKRTPSE
ncbi:MAG: hypothetical protein HOW73_29755 [Polyangiaceae bacterium]|nr:hypothetical protein [Polyangiaceae bacterium]